MGVTCHVLGQVDADALCSVRGEGLCEGRVRSQFIGLVLNECKEVFVFLIVPPSQVVRQ